jgi:hypothetical protein
LPTPKLSKNSSTAGILTNFPNHRRTSHTLRGNGKELSKQIDESVNRRRHIISRLSSRLNWRSPSITATKAFEKSLYSGNLEELPNHRRISHTLRGNGKELSKQIDESVKLTNHAKDRPPKHNQNYSTKE